jgi:hypothetical protein
MEVLEGLGADDREEFERLSRNGAGIARAMHDAAHGKTIMASQLAPTLPGWSDMATEMTLEAKQQNPEAFQNVSDLGTLARWMVDNVYWDADGRAIVPMPNESQSTKDAWVMGRLTCAALLNEALKRYGENFRRNFPKLDKAELQGMATEALEKDGLRMYVEDLQETEGRKPSEAEVKAFRLSFLMSFEDAAMNA